MPQEKLPQRVFCLRFLHTSYRKKPNISPANRISCFFICVCLRPSGVHTALAGLSLGGALALKAVRGGAQGIGDVLIGRQEFQVLRSDGWEQVKGNLKRRLGIIYESPSDSVILPELSVGCDQAQSFVAQAGHGGKALDFAASELGGLEHRALDDPARVANERAASFTGPLHCQLHAFDHAQM